MKKSPYPLEQSFGMCWYATDTEGIGGRLRARPGDFLVEELPEDIGTEGKYLICRLRKKNWELQRAVKEIAKRLGVSHRRIGFSGTKDRSAVTTQYISIYDVAPEDVERISIKDIELTIAGRSGKQLQLGSLAGNRFEIVISETTGPDPEEQVRLVAEAAGQGLPNYFGLQRFGGIRPVTHVVGEYILHGDYENAVATYIGLAFPTENEEVKKARDAFFETRDPLAALHAFPVRMTWERSLLHHLQVHPGDYAGALRGLPPKLLSMFVSAFQSYLFNCAVSARMAEGTPLSEPEPGDRLLFADGKEDRVTRGNLPAARVHLKRGRCRVAVMMPGSCPVQAVGIADEEIARILKERNIGPEQFRKAQEFVSARFDGALRPATLSARVDYSVDGRDVRLAFTLEPGQYATTVCREFMKAPPEAMI